MLYWTDSGTEVELIKLGRGGTAQVRASTSSREFWIRTCLLYKTNPRQWALDQWNMHHAVEAWRRLK